MGRPARLQFEGAFYHVYSRGNRREQIFIEDADYRVFEEILLDQSFRCTVNLYAWCPMPNHFHLAIETPHANLASYIQRLLTTYARYFNIKYKKVGHVFQGRYGAKLVDREEYLLELVRYIDLNVYRVKNPNWSVPEEGWPWGSHRFYVKGGEPAVAAPYIHAVLRRFSDNIATARQRYRAFIVDGLSSGKWQNFYKVTEGRFIGNERWVNEAKIKAGEPIDSTGLPMFPRFDVFLKVVALETGIPVERVVSRERSSQLANVRQMIAFMAVELWHQDQATVAQEIQKDASTVSHLLRRTTWNRSQPLIQRILARIAISQNGRL